MNLQSWILLVVVLILAGVAIWHIRTHKKHCCGGGCGSCPYSGNCRHKKGK